MSRRATGSRQLRLCSVNTTICRRQVDEIAESALRASVEVCGVAEGVRPESMAAILGALDAAGLIERRPDPEDGRRQLITLSAAGRERATGDRQARAEWLARRLHEDFTEPERQTLIAAAALLERLVQR